MQICPGCGEENPPRFRLCGFCGTPLVAAERPRHEVRKVVTILFSDLCGSTELGERLDSETLREIVSRYFDRMRQVLEEHGGTVEKFIGDAIMAVFGLPRVREDDALRAVRAAAEMREALRSLNEELEGEYGVTLANRTGVNTGEVVADDTAAGQRLVTGDTVNLAARLEQAAPPHEVLVGESTFRLVSAAIEAVELEPLELRGKAERARAYRLVRVADASHAKQHEGGFVGREEELAALVASFDEAVTTGRPRLVRIVGEPGLGKSRLVEELERQLADRTRPLHGRCLPYGRGITFWPLLELSRDAAGIEDGDAPPVALAKLERVCGDEEVVARLASALGLADTHYSLDEVYWAARKLLEGLAQTRPLVVFVDDVHWAEDAFLDLLEHVAGTAAAPMLLVCACRPDLLERRPGWAATSPQLELAPLPAASAELVVAGVLGGGIVDGRVSRRIMEAAEGNPLYAEQLTAMLVDEGLLEQRAGVWIARADLHDLALPPTIHALLAARLALLDDDERAIVDVASVIGMTFGRDAVRELAPEDLAPRLGPLLDGLLAKRLLTVVGADADGAVHRFAHVLIRDVAYQGLLKRTRAGLHERFVVWAERVNRARGREAEFDEILGYHLEQAHRYLADLGPLDAHGVELGARGASRLGAAGDRAFARGDMAAAANLLRRAAALLPDDSTARLALLPDLGEALMEAGEFEWAQVFLDDAVERSAAAGLELLHADSLLTRLLVRHHSTADLAAWRAEVKAETERLAPLLERHHAYAEAAKAWRLAAFVHATVCAWEPAAAAQRRALENARRAGNRQYEARLSAAYAYSLCDGPTPVSEGIARCEEMLARGLGHRQSEAIVLTSLATLRALTGDFVGAREACRNARRTLDELGAVVFAAATSLTSARIELLAGDAEAAERELARDHALLEAMDERYFRPLVAAMLADSIAAQGRTEEAGRLAETAGALAAEDDVETQALARLVRATAAARAGERAAARGLVAEALELVPGSQAPLLRVEVLLRAAAVARSCGEPGEALNALGEARALCALKQMPAPATRVEALAAELGEAADALAAS